MEISEVRVKLVPRSTERLRAFCSITLDGDFVIRDLKIIDGANGPFVAMPSRKLADRCNRCGCKNHLRAKYCNECGQKLGESRTPKDAQGRAKLHADVAHPINAGCREKIQNAVVAAYQAELERAKSPDYQPPAFDDFEDNDSLPPDAPEEESPAPAASAGDGTGSQGERGNADADFSDYNSLITDLKREAEGRRKRHSEQRSAAAERAEGRSRRYPDSQDDHATQEGGLPERDDEKSDRPPEEPSPDEAAPTLPREQVRGGESSGADAGKKGATGSTGKGGETAREAPRPRTPPPSPEDEAAGEGFGAGL